MNNYAIIEDKTVVNIVLWDGDTKNWSPPENSVAILIPFGANVGIGDDYINGAFVPHQVENVPSPEENGKTFALAAAAYMATVRATRELILNRLAGIGVAALYAEDTTTAAGVVAAREALLALPGLPSVTAATDIDSLKAAVLTAYRAAASGAPASVRTAFAAADA